MFMELQIFSNSEFGEIRTITKDNEPMFCLADVCKALEISNVSQLKTRLKEDGVITNEVGVQTGVKADGTPAIQKVRMNFINESNLYKTIFQSRKESAERFTDWVTSEVLPSIRKTGSYQKQLSPQEMMRIQLGMLDDVSDRVSKLENTMNIDYGQQKVLNDLVSARVIKILGGKDSNAYKEISKKVFAEINHDYKDYFNVNSRANTPRLKNEQAIEYVKNWMPSTNTMMLIKDCNAQMNFEN
jgi:prophage antirepressor-like protein